MTDSPSRRGYLRRCTALGLGVGLAGCTASEDDPSAATANPGETPDATPDPDGTATPEPDPPVAWRRDEGAAVESSPTVARDTAYVGTADGTVRALDAADGTERWSFAAAGPIRSRPLVADGAVFVVAGELALSSNHVVHALDAADGTERWRFAPESWWLELVGTSGGRAYVATADDSVTDGGETLYALSTEDGERAWSGEIGDPSGGLVAAGTVYVPSYGRLYAYDAATGECRWKRPTRRYSYRTLAVTEDAVFYASTVDGTRGVLTAVDAETGDAAWTFDRRTVTSTTLRDGTLFAGGERILAFDPDSSDPKWESDAGGFVPRAPVRDGTLYAGGDAIRAYATDDGAVGWEWTPETAASVLVPAAATERAVYVDAVHDDDPRTRTKFAVGRDGATRWTFASDTRLTDLAVGGELAFAGGEDGYVYALGA